LLPTPRSHRPVRARISAYGSSKHGLAERFIAHPTDDHSPVWLSAAVPLTLERMAMHSKCFPVVVPMFRCLASLVRVRLGVVPRAQRYYQDTMISCNPFRVASFSFARRYHSCIRFALTSWIRFLPARSFELTASPSRWFDVEMTGPPKFLGDPSVPFAHAQATPVSRLVPDRDIRKCRFQNRRVVPARGSTKTLTRKLSKFSYMAFGLAVYASRCTLPIHHARLASGRWSDATRRDSHPQGHYQRFQIKCQFISSSSFAKLLGAIPVSSLS
jgi:hypothetical protein